MMFKIFLLCLLTANYVNANKHLLVKFKHNDDGNRERRDANYVYETIDEDLELRLYDDEVDLNNEIELLSHDNAIEFVEEDYIVSIHETTPNDSKFNLLWGLDNKKNNDIDAQNAWDITTGSNKVIIGIIDTGIDYTHSDLKDNMWVNP